MNEADLSLKRYEVDMNWVNFYFDELTSQHKCFSFMVEQDIEVQQAKPGMVRVYDYYETELSTQTEYKIHQTCGTKEELPFLTSDEYNEAVDQDPSEMGQVRMPIELPPELHEDKESAECPRCLMEWPEDILSWFCEAEHAYKMEVRHGRRMPLKVLSDLRPRGRKQSINAFTTYELPEGCSCPTIEEQGKWRKVMVLTRGNEFQLTESSRGTLHLKPDVTIVPMVVPKKAEREMRRARKQQCRKAT